MSVRLAIGLSGALALALAARVAAARPGLVWAPQPVRVAPLAQVRGLPPFVPESAADGAGEVQIGPERAAALWLDALDVVRVTHRGQGALRIARVLGGEGGGARALVFEPGIAGRPGETYLVEPPGRGDVWAVTAERPVTVTVERPVTRDGRLVWESVERELLGWVASGSGAPPPAPLVSGSASLALGLRTDKEIADALVREDASLRTAATAWRLASALAAVTAVRPLLRQYFFVDDLGPELAGLGDELEVDDPEAAGAESRPFRRVDRAQARWTVELDGPGVLRLEARPILSNATVIDPPVVDLMARAAGGLVLGRRRAWARPAWTPDPSDPPPAFPSREPLRSNRGDYLGERVVLSVSLSPGRHRYELAVAGGPIALRVSAAHHRPTLLGLVRGEASVSSYLEQARVAARNGPSAAARLLRALAALASPQEEHAAPAPAASGPRGEAPASGGGGPPPGGRGLPPFLELAGLAYRPAAPTTFEVERAVRLAATLAGEPTSWYVVSRLCARLATDDRTVELRSLLGAMRGDPPPELVPALVEALPTPALLERVRSLPVAALEAAWRRDLVDPSLRETYRAAWRASRWVLVPPAPPADDAVKWLEVGRARAAAHAAELPWSDEPGTLWHLPLGSTRRVLAPPSALDPSRPVLLQVYVSTAAERPGPFHLRVDAGSWSSLGVEPLERLAFAVAPGEHTLRVDGPEATDAYVSLPQVDRAPAGDGGYAVERRGWPIVAGGARVRWALPRPDLAGPVEVRVRAAAGEPRQLAVAIRTDAGVGRELTFWPGAAASGAVAVAGGGRVSRELTVVFWPPAGARSLWLESSDGVPVFAAVSIRWARSWPGAAAPLVPVAGGDPLEQVSALSRQLVRAPENGAALLQRAGLLLDLGQPDLARQDIYRAARLPALVGDAGIATAVDELLLRLEERALPAHVTLGAVERLPVPLEPALLALGGEDLGTWLDAVRVGRREGPARALAAAGRAAGPVAEYLRARWRAAAGEPVAASQRLARAWLAGGPWQLGLEALRRLDVLLDGPQTRPPPGAAPLAFGLTAVLRPDVEPSWMRRTLLGAAAESRWDPLDGTEENAGQEHLYVDDGSRMSTPLTAVRQALLATPWPASGAQLVSAGEAAMLDLALVEAAALRADVFCLQVRAGADGEDLPCQLTLAVDGHRSSRSAPAREATSFELGRLGPGRHGLEVALQEQGVEHLLSVRYVSNTAIGDVTVPDGAGRHVIPRTRRTRQFVATPRQPVAVTVLGPTALWVEARAVDPAAGRSVVVEATAARGGGAGISRSASLPESVDPTARGDGPRRLVVSPAATVPLVLPDGVPYTIMVRPSQGKLLARLAMRVDRASPRARRQGPWWAQATAPATLFRVPALGDPVPIEAPAWTESAPQPAGTVSLGFTAGREDMQAFDRPGRLRDHAGAFVSLRSQFSSGSWLRVTPLARRREESGTVLGGTADLVLTALPFDLSCELGARFYRQELVTALAWRAGGDLAITGRAVLAPSLALLPGVGLSLDRFSLAPADATGARREEVDPRVSSSYLRAHPRALSGRLELVWLAAQDQIGVLAAGVVSNASGRTPDRAAVAVDWSGLLELPFLPLTLLEATYRPSYRFADANRLAAFVRHDVLMSLSWSLWTGAAGRFFLTLSGGLFLATDASSRSVASLALRYDLTGGRGLRDMLPGEGSFRDRVEQRMWAETPPGRRLP